MSDFVPMVSETERTLVTMLSNYSVASWYPQDDLDTPFCTFFLDATYSVRPDRVIGVECDGQKYHDDPVREFCRDALILGTGRIACIYHIESWAVRKRYFDWLYILSELEPEVFSAERREAIRGLAAGYDRLTALKLRDRSKGFMFKSTAATPEVRQLIEFAGKNEGIAFPTLVERVRRGSLVRGGRRPV